MRRMVWVLALLPALAVILAACGAGDSSARAPGKKKIIFLTMQLSPTFDEYFHALIAEFEAEHPDVTIVWQDMPFQSYETKLMTSFMGPNPPDVINLPSESLETYLSADYIQPLDAYLGTEILDDYVPGILEDGTQYGGKTYAAPWYAAVSVTFANAKLLEQAGLDSEKTPEFYEDLPDIARRIKQKTGKFGAYPLYTEAASLRLFLMEAGVPLLDENGRAIFYTPRGVEVFKFWTDLYRDGLVPPEALTAVHRHPVEQYKTGNLAILVTAPQFIRQVKSDAPDIFANTIVGPLMHWKDAQAYYVSLHTLAVSRKTKHPEVAAEFAAFVTNARNQLEFSKLTIIFPSSNGALDDLYFTNPEDTMEGQARKVAAHMVKNGVVYRPPSDSRNLYNVMEEITESVALGKMDADEGLKLAEDRWNAILQK